MRDFEKSVKRWTRVVVYLPIVLALALLCGIVLISAIRVFLEVPGCLGSKECVDRVVGEIMARALSFETVASVASLVVLQVFAFTNRGSARDVVVAMKLKLEEWFPSR